MRIKAVLGDIHALPDPDRKRPGKGSVVTIVELVEGGPSGPTVLTARYFDEWGQLDQMPVAWLRVVE